jgi:uncharacterized protein (TIGR03435 family)
MSARLIVNAFGLVAFALLAFGAAEASMQAEAGGAAAFEVISIKKLDPRAPAPPGRRIQGHGVFQTRTTVAGLLYFTHGFEPVRLVNLPEWARRDVFDIDARAAAPASLDEMIPMLRAMLAERFGLATHTERRAVPHYELRLGESDTVFGPHFRKSDCAPAPPRPPEPSGTRYAAWGCFEIGMALVAVGGQIQMPVVDRTGLTGTFAYQLALPLDEPRDLGFAASTMQRLVKEQWGLTLAPSRDPIDVLVIDALRPPTDN